MLHAREDYCSRIDELDPIRRFKLKVRALDVQRDINVS